MSRSNNTYPTYTKTPYIKEKAPLGWDNGVRRCISCKKDWPNLPEFSPSPCCNEQAGVVADGAPEMGWSQAYSELMAIRFERFYEKWNEGLNDLELSWTSNEEVSDEEMNEGLVAIDHLISSLETHDDSTTT